ncbi:MAG: hypothetical protein ABIJ97_15895 [Bacteroidota bacterium]
MRNKILIFSSAILFLVNINIMAQFQIYNPGNLFGRTNLNIRGIGIGHFPNGVPLNAAFHVNTNYMNQSTFFNRGEVFRTDCPDAETTFWHMYKGGTPMFNINNPTGSNDVNLTGVQNGNMNFLTTNTQRMTIRGNNGYVGIGTTTPKAKLEVANGDIAVTAIGSGIILKATNGENFYRITVDNKGKLSTKLIANL